MAGYTYRRLYDIDAGLPKGKKIFEKGEDGKYDLALFVQRWVAYNLEKGASDSMSLEEAKATHERVKIEKSRLEVAKMRGELVDINDVKRLWANVATTVVQKMLCLPMVIAERVYMLDNMELVTGIIEKEIRDVLVNISETPIPSEAGPEGKEDEGYEEE